MGRRRPFDGGAGGVTGPADGVRTRIEALGEQGVTEVVYQPCGPDIRGEPTRFIEAVRR